MKRYIITWGANRPFNRSVYYTDYHAEQFCRALRLNGTPHSLTEITT